MLKLNQYKNPQYTNFSSIPLFPVKIRQLNQNGSYDLIPGMFSKLDVNNAEDRQAMIHITKTWNDYSRFINIINANFLDSYSAYHQKLYTVVQACGEIISVAQSYFTERPKSFVISLFLSKPEIKFQNHFPKRKIHGAGESCLYGLLKLVQEQNCDNIVLSAANRKFWRKMGFEVVPDVKTKKDDIQTYTGKLQGDDILKVASRIKAKYQIE